MVPAETRARPAANPAGWSRRTFDRPASPRGTIASPPGRPTSSTVCSPSSWRSPSPSRVPGSLSLSIRCSDVRGSDSGTTGLLSGLGDGQPAKADVVVIDRQREAVDCAAAVESSGEAFLLSSTSNRPATGTAPPPFGGRSSATVGAPPESGLLHLERLSAVLLLLYRLGTPTALPFPRIAGYRGSDSPPENGGSEGK